MNVIYLSLCSLLDCQLQTLSLTLEEITVEEEEDRDDMISYDHLSHDQSQHLLDQVSHAVTVYVMLMLCTMSYDL